MKKFARAALPLIAFLLSAPAVLAQGAAPADPAPQPVTQPATQPAPAGGVVTKQVVQATNYVDKGIDWILDKGPSVIAALILLVIGWVIAGWIRGLVIKALTKAHADITLAKFVANLARWAVLSFVVVTCLGTVGINVTSIAAIIGAAGLAVGLALQGNLGNLASGILLMIFRPFKIGDSVIVAGQSGVVDGIDLFTTNLDTVDNRRIIVPNGAIFGGVIENQTRHPRRAVTIDVTVSGAADVEGTRQALLAAARAVIALNNGGQSDPPPVAALVAISPNPQWTVTVWSRTDAFAAVKQALLIQLKATIEQQKLGVPAAVQLVRQITA